MTLAMLNDICNRNNIPEDVTLLSDSNWECCETQIGAVWYSEIDNAIVLTQSEYGNGDHQYKVDDQSWHDMTHNQTLVLLK